MSEAVAATPQRGPRRIAALPAGAYGRIKRAVDLFASAVVLVLLSPVMLLIAIVIRFDSPGPAIFRQRRIGRGSREFEIMKFRTMHEGTPHLASHLMGPDSPSVTRIGGWLRRTSLDELPQLWNVLQGDMTLVGPRPALYNQYDLIALRQEAGVDALRPGVTGWAQVNGRDELSIEEKVRLDRWYLENVSASVDLAIFGRTLLTLFSARGVN